MIRAAAAVAVIAAAAGCKPRSYRDEDEALLTAMRRFTDRVCACKDRACKDKVQEEMNQWGQDLAKRADLNHPPDEAMSKAMADVFERYAKCLSAKADSAATQAIADPPAGKPIPIDAQISLVRERAAKHPKKLVMSRLEINYARSDGTLDPKYGTLEVSFAVPPAPPADDPSRPIGAPLPPPPTGQHDMDCPEWKFAEGRWQQHETLCMGMTVLAPAHCSVAQVWARTITDEAPPGALATLVLVASEPQAWQFTISDPPRNIDFRKTYPDDCEPVVEKPAK